LLRFSGRFLASCAWAVLDPFQLALGGLRAVERASFDAFRCLVHARASHACAIEGGRLFMRILNYEVKRHRGHKVGETDIGYLSGVKFEHFLNIFLGPCAAAPDFFFIQVGAHNGVSNDHLHNLIEKRKPRGILVEPQTLEFEVLTSNYSHCDTLVFENIAIANEDGEKTFYTIRPELQFLRYANQIASLSHDHTKRLLTFHLSNEASAQVVREFKSRNLKIEDCIAIQTVKCQTFRSLLEKHNVSRYDLLQVDAEGYDYEILKSADLETYKPRLINYEHGNLTEHDKYESWKYLIGLGYHLFTHGMGDTAAYLLD
jgi:FkbM family methyltransferase